MDAYVLCETLSSSSQLRVGKNTDLKLRGNVPQDVVWVIVHELVGRIRADILQQNFPAAWMIVQPCLLYTSPSPRDLSTSRMPSSA